MTLSDDDIRQHLRLREDSSWEFKQIEFRGDRPVRPARDDWADEITAFANASGGVILCGVSDAGKLQDLTPEQLVELDRLIVEICADSVKPALPVEIHHHEVDGKALLLVTVPKGSSVHENKGRSFIRIGASKRAMASEERLRLSQTRSQARHRWFDEQTVAGTGFETLHEALWMPLLSVAGRANPQAALEKMSLLGADDQGNLRATVAGILSCCKNPEEWLPQACISATLYRGLDRASGQIDAQTIFGPLTQQIAEAVAFAARNMRIGAHKDPARIDLPQYSVRALFEAITNAVVHRDYSAHGGRIRLSMFADRIEIQSPGALANNIGVEDLPFRQATRNEVLASVLGRTGVGGIKGAEERGFIMERRGDGIPIIRNETKQLAGRLPEFKLIGGSELLVVLPSAPTQPSPALVEVEVSANQSALAGAAVLVLFPNHTWKSATTDSFGRATLGIHTTELPLTVFVAAADHAAHMIRNWLPSSETVSVELDALPDGGSAIFEDKTGHLPGLTGRLNPIRDNLDRTYLYASNIAINEGKPQPVHFALNEDLHLVDSNGVKCLVRIVQILGGCALVQYRSPGCAS
ncbi:MAG: putative DNA binding domain-containing protein [Gammaproteobacteria bacterium]|nr:putative DNA binding domain-containing protein [Gammaproteobacteria bacterium]